jgi:murein DD-endopeptidase MepM/ murein hydrolase activator NlpD
MDINRSVLTWVAIVIFVLIAIGWYAGNQNVKEKSNPTLPLALTVTPETVIQGDPVMITLAGTTTSANIKSGSVSATALSFMIYQNTPTSFYGTGINQKTGSTTVTVILNDGTKKGKVLTTTLFIKPRIRPEEPLPIPAQLGGNSPANQIVVENTLNTENAEIAAVPSYKKGAFWTEAFAFPLANPANGKTDGVRNDSVNNDGTGLKVTDPYGYNRDTGEITIPHKGTDFKAASGTPVYAINDGLVRLTSTFVVYGNTVIIDHGLGIESLYMHLSRIVATPGEVVKRGQLIGYSGETGYAVGPHLHLSIKIGGVSIDPMKFFALFHQENS